MHIIKAMGLAHGLILVKSKRTPKRNPRMLPTDLRLLVFDLDGTLIDSQQDLANSVNATLANLSLPQLALPTIATYIGDGASMLVRRALAQASGSAPSEDLATQALEFFLDYYREHKLDFTYVYPGVLDSLQSIRTALPHIKMAVLTNKPVRPSRQICDALGLSRFFFQNYGGDSFITKKPDPEGLLRLIDEAAAEPSQTVMIGDSGVDVQTAHNAGAWSIGCAFGLSPVSMLAAEPSAVAQTAHDWPALLNLPA